MGPDLPPEISGFESSSVSEQSRQSVEQFAQLHTMELRDVNQQITMRPIVAIFFAILLLYQNILVFGFVAWALQTGKMAELQLIFSVLIAGSLLQSYKISQLIVNKLFEPIDYADKHARFK